MNKFPNSKLSEITYYFECLFFIALVIVLLYFNSYYFMLDGENGPVELPGAIALLITTILLGYSGYLCVKNNLQPKYKAYLLLGAALFFLFITGEETSWGQHITGHATPEWLQELNDQKETNIHNMDKKSFDLWASRVIFLFSGLTALFHFKNKQYLFSIRLPEAPLALGFLLLPVYRNFGTINSDIWDFGFILFGGYMYLSIKKKDFRILYMTILFIITSITVYYVHRNYAHLFNGRRNIYHEIRESVFALLCLAYAIQIFKDVKKETR